jgi:hypothetical protein
MNDWSKSGNVSSIANAMIIQSAIPLYILGHFSGRAAPFTRGQTPPFSLAANISEKPNLDRLYPNPLSFSILTDIKLNSRTPTKSAV